VTTGKSNGTRLHTCKLLGEIAKSKVPGVASIPHVLAVGSGKKTQKLFEILCATRPADVTDSRDKFSGVLSLIEEQEAIRNLATLDETTTMVYIAIGIHPLSKYRLVMLQVTRHPHDTFPNLVSWIPGWSRRDANDELLRILDTGAFYSKGNFYLKTRTLECCQVNCPGEDHLLYPVLSTHGFRLSQIWSLGAVFDFECSREQCHDGIRRVIKTNRRCKNNPCPPPLYMPFRR